jgi:tetratricopeptide (TPR) repeat protein
MKPIQHIIAAAACAILATVIAAPGRAQAQQSGPSAPAVSAQEMSVIPLTPAEKEAFRQIAKLQDEAAKALSAGRYQIAEADARQALSLGQNTGVANQILAEALMAQGKDEEAMQEYAVVAHFCHPNDLLPYALLLMKAGRWTEAVDAYNKALPYLSEGNTVREFSNITVASPHPLVEAYIHIALGLTYSWGNDEAENPEATKSLVELRQAIKLAPDSALANYELGWEYGNQRDLANAQGCLVKAIQLGAGDLKKAARDEYTHTLYMKDKSLMPATLPDQSPRPPAP